MAGVKILLNRIGIRSEFVNPGGRTIELVDGTSIALSDQCNFCDAAKILKCIEKKK